MLNLGGRGVSSCPSTGSYCSRQRLFMITCMLIGTAGMELIKPCGMETIADVDHGVRPWIHGSAHGSRHEVGDEEVHLDDNSCAWSGPPSEKSWPQPPSAVRRSVDRERSHGV